MKKSFFISIIILTITLGLFLHLHVNAIAIPLPDHLTTILSGCNTSSERYCNRVNSILTLLQYRSDGVSESPSKSGQMIWKKYKKATFKIVEPAENSYKAIIAHHLEKLSTQEREYLSNFFQYLIRVSGFGYILFGDKPMGIDFIDYNMPTKSVSGFDYMDDHHIIYKYRFKEGWEIWKKYQHLFPSKNFVFLEYSHKENHNYLVICLINLNSFIRTIYGHIKDFQLVFGENMSPEEILDSYIKKEKAFEIINNHDGLFGTLLGYGRDNAWTFMTQANLEDRQLVSFVETVCKENYEEVSILLPGFMALPHSRETSHLANSYKNKRLEIKKLSSKNEFLLPALNAMISSY